MRRRWTESRGHPPQQRLPSHRTTTRFQEYGRSFAFLLRTDYANTRQESGFSGHALYTKNPIVNSRVFFNLRIMTATTDSSTNPSRIKKVRKAVLPAAGLGTRFLPATKAQPKEMLNVVDKPQIQYVVEECVASGIEHIIIVTGKGKNSIEDHFDYTRRLNATWKKKAAGSGRDGSPHQRHGSGQLYAPEGAAGTRSRRAGCQGSGRR